MNDDTRISWKYEGVPDFVNGKEAYFEEKLLEYGANVIIPVFFVSFGRLAKWTGTHGKLHPRFS